MLYNSQSGTEPTPNDSTLFEKHRQHNHWAKIMHLHILILKSLHSSELFCNSQVWSANWAQIPLGMMKYKSLYVKRKSLSQKKKKFLTSKENLTESGFEPETSGLTYQRSTNWAIQPYVGGSPNCRLSLLRVGCQSEAINPEMPYSQ